MGPPDGMLTGVVSSWDDEDDDLGNGAGRKDNNRRSMIMGMSKGEKRSSTVGEGLMEGEVPPTKSAKAVDVLLGIPTSSEKAISTLTGICVTSFNLPYD